MSVWGKKNDRHCLGLRFHQSRITLTFPFPEWKEIKSQIVSPVARLTSQKSFAKSRSSPLTLTLTSFLSRLSGGFLICPTLQCPWQPLKFGQQPANDGVRESTESKKKKAAIWQTVPTTDEEDTFVSISNNKICTKSRACFVTVWCKKM